MSANGRAWFAWPKGGGSAINKDKISGLLKQHGLTTVSDLAIDERWGAIKLMHPKDERAKA